MIPNDTYTPEQIIGFCHREGIDPDHPSMAELIRSAREKQNNSAEIAQS